MRAFPPRGRLCAICSSISFILLFDIHFKGVKELKRKTDKDIVCGHKGIIIFFSLIVLVGIIVTLIPLFQQKEYQYEEKTIHVDNVEYEPFGKKEYQTLLIASDGETYIIGNDDGAYQYAFTDTDITIRYHETTTFFARQRIVDQVTWSGGTFDTHSEKAADRWYIAVIAGIVIMLIGACGLLIVYMDVRRNRKMQKDRDQRIIKKYGDKAKVE